MKYLQWITVVIAWILISLLVPAAFAEDKVTHYVDVELDSDSCPIDVYPELIIADAGDLVEWQSVVVNRQGKQILEVTEVDKSYAIVFDPFAQGARFRSHSDGNLLSTPLVVELSEDVDYKYTIVSTDDSGCPPLDPRLRIKK